MQEFTISNASNVDPSDLAAIRVEAMKPSLEAVGRFNPERAKRRFLDTYEPKDTNVIYVQGNLVGFYVVRERPDHLYLDHLYILPAHQGCGIGRRLVRLLQAQASRLSLPVRIVSLRGSQANDFYLSCGFVLDHHDELDNYYQWTSSQSVKRNY